MIGAASATHGLKYIVVEPNINSEKFVKLLPLMKSAVPQKPVTVHADRLSSHFSKTTHAECDKLGMKHPVLGISGRAECSIIKEVWSVAKADYVKRRL